MKIIFIGTSEFGAIILEKLAKSTNKPFLAVTAPEKRSGRKQIIVSPPVKISAERCNIPVVQPKKINDFAGEIKKLEPDLIILAAYGQIIPKEILIIPRYGCLNIHPSLLPLWRGPSPIQQAILNNDRKTGVTIIKMTGEVDKGPIVSQKEIEMSGKETFQDLRDALAELSSQLLVETLPGFFSGKNFPQPQDDLKTTYAKILNKQDGKINWQKTAQEIERQIRAFNPWPGSYTFFKYKNKLIKVKIFKSRVSKSAEEKTLAVKCAKDFLIIERLQMEGGKEMASDDFLRGHPDFISALPF
jgi:methionyl-tRNA formyltransferase